MHLRKLVLACGLVSCALSNYVSALGLGEVKLKSTLNQPLSAEVQLLDTKGLSPEQIIVALASSSDFDRNGLDFIHFYTEFKFEVALDNPSGPVVRITSRSPVREPYLNFLVEAKWSSGRLLREYTLLMDLPTFDDKVPQAVQAAPGSASKSMAAKATQSPEDAAIAAEVQAAVDAANAEEKPDIIAEQDQPAKKSNAAVGTYGPVGAKDTLWGIALAVRPESSTNIHQTMLALQRLNPKAFIRGNINLLKKGQVLRVPDAHEITRISRSEAIRQFKTQDAEWTSAGAGSTDLGAQLDATGRTTRERTVPEAVLAGRVTLEAPSSTDTTANGQGSGANKGAGKALESELATVLEELDKAKSEKTELSSRVHELEDQVNTMQRLVDVSNEKLRALQLNSAKKPEKDIAEAVASIPAEHDDSVVEVFASSASQAVSTPVTAEAVSSVAAVVPETVVPKPPAPKIELKQTIVDWLSNNILWVGVGAAAILMAAGFAVMRRHKSQEDAAQRHENTDELFNPVSSFDSFNQTHEAALAADTSADELSLFDEEDTTAVAETGDVVGEADIYIAYGKFEQAEEMLINGLEKDPSSTEIRLKLLEVYSQTHNLTKFDKHYAAILPMATAVAAGRAKELRNNIPNASEFPVGAVAHGDNLLGFDEGFNLDHELVLAQPSVLAASDDLSVDLGGSGDLTASATPLDDGMDFIGKTGINKIASVDDEFFLEFNLDDSAVKHHQSNAEDLSDITSVLDSLDNDGLAHEIEVLGQDTFNFDVQDLRNEPSLLTEKMSGIQSVGFNDDVAVTDDFNLDMDVNNLDLAALDNEMANFDAELNKFNDEKPIESASRNNEFVQRETKTFNVVGHDDALADLDENLTFEAFESLAADSNVKNTVLNDSLGAERDDSGLTWANADDVTREPVTGVAVADLKLEVDDDFDIDSPIGLLSETRVHDLDEELAQEPSLTLNEADKPAVEEDLFEQALSDFSAENLALENASEMSDDDMDAELDVMADADEAATKLDLARAYIDMGDSEGARDILAEVAHEGNEQQRQEAVDLLSRIDA